MQEKIHILKQIVQGNRLIETRQKFFLLGAIAAMTHVVLGFFFIWTGVAPFVYYNIGIALVYIIITYISRRRDQYMTLYYFSLMEIIVHSCLATFFLGMNKGFLVYILAYIPGSYYLENNLIENRDSIKSATLMAVLSSICYVVSSCAAGGRQSSFDALFSAFQQRALYTFNVVMGLSYLLVFSFLFALEIRYANVLLREENSRLGIAANHDALTGIMNRRGMTATLKHVIDDIQHEDKVFCLIMADIDKFKEVNDTYGHDIGDIVLRDIARIYRENIREDDIASRWGGEEFLIMINADIHIAKMIAERIRKLISEREYSAQGEKFSVTVTMGITEYQKGMQLRTMIELADQKLYYGKNHGRDQTVI